MNWKRLKNALLGLLAVLLMLGDGLAEEVQLSVSGGVYKVPVTINGTVHLNFTLDSGASDVHITPDVLLTLLRSGTISDSDMVGPGTYVLADGREVQNRRVRLREVRIGSVVVENVVASVSDNLEGSLLLGQSFLARPPRWSVDNARQVLVLETSGGLQTLWRENHEFSLRAGHDWKPQASEQYHCLMTDGHAILCVMEVEEQSGTDALARKIQNFYHGLDKLVFVDEWGGTITDATTGNSIPAVLSKFESKDLSLLTYTFRYGGWSYIVMGLWSPDDWDGYEGEIREIMKSIRMHWEVE
ncbi:MAG: retropepsin-like aspartic protease [Vulcanimicrobiota bacterium]